MSSVLTKSLISFPLSLSLSPSLPPLTVLLHVGLRLTPRKAVNYQRWQRSLRLAAITHILQPPSKAPRSNTQVQAALSEAEETGGGAGVRGWGVRGWVQDNHSFV